jgi:high-affinity Fe2+/Pb2+ permease
MADTRTISDAVQLERNRINRFAIYLAIAILVLGGGWQLIKLVQAESLGWQGIFAIGPFVIAYLIARRLPDYSDKHNG